MKRWMTFVLLLFVLHTHAQTAAMYDIVIDEIMADPSPAVGLPNTEFVELKNVSQKTININGWRIGDASGFATIAVNYTLRPDSFVVLCPNSSAAALSTFGAVIGLSNFPSLNNDADVLYLHSKEGGTIHAVAYSADWYRNPVKSQGGWTLEMIDSKNPCTGLANWVASTDVRGGTPGRKNTADAVNPDQQPPVLQRAFASDSTHIVLQFDEPLDSARAASPASYNIGNGSITAVAATALAPLFNKVQVRIPAALVKNKTYQLTVSAVADCAGNVIGGYNTIKLGLAAIPDTGDVVINEILYNPAPDGSDYVELYNRSNKNIDLKDCYIANRTGGVLGVPKQISPDSRVFFPGEYLVITADQMAVEKQFLAKDPAAFAVVSSMPSFSDDKGVVVILSTQGILLDELAYDDHWQFALLNNHEGVALERIDFTKPTQDAANWHSAATSAGYGTPGYQNSQFKMDAGLSGHITVSPAVFSPDNDGFNDFLTISYQFPEPGYVCNITAFDAAGHSVRLIVRNGLCAEKGYFRWDGLNEHSLKLPVGVYVVLTEVFNLKGKTSRFKQAVTLARRL